MEITKTQLETMKKRTLLKVLSLFDGISCARVALERLGIPVSEYYASEIDKYAISVSKMNHPHIIHVGDVKNVHGAHHIDLLIGGSPCQDLSIAKANRKGLDGERSSLFWEYVRILREVKPKYFILENVASMRASDRDIISEALGVQPVMINAALVSAQQRKRYFWVGKLDEFGTYKQVEIPQPEDRGIYLKDILLDGDTEDLKSLYITASYHKKNGHNYAQKRDGQMIRVGQIGKGGQGERIYSPTGKSVALSALGGAEGQRLDCI